LHDKHDDGDDGSDTQTDDLSASSFGVDLDGDDLADPDAERDAADGQLEAAADHYAEAVARYWGTPEGDWWP
jgi:hypothetical protein